MHFNALKFKRLIKIHFIPNRVFPTLFVMRCNYCRPGKVLKHRELRCPILQEIGLFSHPWHPKTREMGTPS